MPAILFTSAGPDAPGREGAAVALVVIQATTLLWMPKRPEAAMSVAIATGVGIEQLCPTLGIFGAANIVLSGFSWLRPPRVSLWALGVMIALAPLRLASGGGATAVVTAIGASALAWTWGELMRVRRARRADAAQRAVAEERARIARELHDVVAHNVSLHRRPGRRGRGRVRRAARRARDALREDRGHGRAALAELRRLLEIVRPDSAGDANAPQPGLDRLDALAQARGRRGSGRGTREGAPVDLPPGVDLSAYRIVQEALTNTLRHAGATRADVTVRYGADALELEVVDDGARRGRRAGDGGGHGIVGMRERAALLGGTLEAGPRPGGGFRVRAGSAGGAAMTHPGR